MVTAGPATRNREPNSSAHCTLASVTKENSAAWHRAERCFAEKTERETQLQWRASVPKASSVTGPFADLHPHPAVAEGARPTPLGECLQQFPATMDTSKTQFNGPVLKDFQQCISISKICY